MLWLTSYLNQSSQRADLFDHFLVHNHFYPLMSILLLLLNSFVTTTYYVSDCLSLCTGSIYYSTILCLVSNHALLLVVT